MTHFTWIRPLKHHQGTHNLMVVLPLKPNLVVNGRRYSSVPAR